MNIEQISVNREVPSREVVEKAASVLLDGGVVIYPSDTVYGVMCRADSLNAVSRIRQMKGYKAPRPFILIVDGIKMAESLADITDPEVREILLTRWPGKLTFVLPAKGNCPEWVKEDDNSVALRYPADSLSNSILSKCGIPLVSTSANLCKEPSVLCAESIDNLITQSVDLVIDGGTLPESSPSTVIKLLRGRT